MRRFALVFVCDLLLVSVSQGAGFVHNSNFVVFTEASLSAEASQHFAQSVLERAEQYRREISREWLGEELPAGIGRATINVRFSSFEDRGLTWAIDHSQRRMHSVYLTTSAQSALGDTLAHEMVHVVLATRFPHPNRLPAWLEEGIASRYDGPQRRQTRESVVRWLLRTGHWPSLDLVLSAEVISAEDTQSYTAAATLTDMLLARAGKEKLIEFGEAASPIGWQRALQQHYQISDAHQLQSLWQQWVSEAGRNPSVNHLSQIGTHGQ